MKFSVKHKWDANGVNARTLRTALRVEAQKEWLKNIETDPRKEERLKRQECCVCFYTTRICGQGFTKFNCAICAVEVNWHNTCVPMLCTSCAVSNDVCQNCGGDLNLNLRS